MNEKKRRESATKKQISKFGQSDFPEFRDCGAFITSHFMPRSSDTGLHNTHAIVGAGFTSGFKRSVHIISIYIYI
jgi:hypothetical protein